MASLEEFNNWMINILVQLNQNKTDIMIVDLAESYIVTYLGPWSAYCNDQRVVFEPELQFYKQTNAVVKSSLFSRLLD